MKWRALKHPLRLGLRGWRWLDRALISPRGTVFETRHTRAGTWARQRRAFELADN